MKTAVGFVAFLLSGGLALAGPSDDADSDLIPGNLPSSAKQPSLSTSGYEKPSSISQKISLEDSLTGWNQRGNLLVPVPTTQPNNQNRLSLDANLQYQFSDKLKFAVSDRFSSYAGDTIEWNQNGFARNDFREAYASYEFLPRTYLEVGRINEKFGSAVGYNPTDFFKTRTLVDLSSIDPSTQRENRLGVGVVSLQKLFEGGSFNLIYSPHLQSTSRLLTNPPTAVDPLFGQTNSVDRYLGAISYELLGINTQTLLYRDDIGTHVGFNVSHLVSNSVVVYADWSGVNEQNLSQRVVAFGQSTGSIPAGVPVVPQTDTSSPFSSDAAVGFSWSNDSKLSTNLEYHYHQSGFSSQDFNNWISAGQSNAQLANELWFIRQYAADQQEPLMQQEVFLRLEQQDAFINYLNIGLTGFVNVFDGSFVTQIYGQYFLSNHWTLSAYLTGSFGSTSTEKGSIPWVENGVVQVKRYF
jgi:hypothetical protein